MLYLQPVRLDCRLGVCHRDAYNSTIQPSVAQFLREMLVLSDTNFHARAGDPANMKVCACGTWNVRMLMETVLSMLTTVCHFKKMTHRIWDYFHTRLAFTISGLEPVSSTA